MPSAALIEVASAALQNERESWHRLWQGMPEFIQMDEEPWKSVTVHFQNRTQYDRFLRMTGCNVYHDKWAWYPPKTYGSFLDVRCAAPGSDASPRWPVYIPSKGRAATPLTSRELTRLGVRHKVVVQPQEAGEYAAAVGADNLLVLPVGLDGLVPARNWIWDHAEASGARRFWTFDDNIRTLYRLNRNVKVRLADGAALKIMEEFADRFDRLPILGMQYEMFAPRKSRIPPLQLNTRVYSNMLIETGLKDDRGRPMRNRGTYNDDTDLCLRVLKMGLPTVLFQAFLADKVRTMVLGGGNTPIYQGDGRRKMAEELRSRHPDVTKVVWKWCRWQHEVNYAPFAANPLRLRPGRSALRGVDEHGMEFQRLVDGRWTPEPDDKAEIRRLMDQLRGGDRTGDRSRSLSTLAVGEVL